MAKTEKGHGNGVYVGSVSTYKFDRLEQHLKITHLFYQNLFHLLALLSF